MPEIYRSDALIIDDLAKQLLPAGEVPTELPLSRLRQVVLHKTDEDTSTPHSSARYHIEHNGRCPPRGTM